MLTNIFLLFLSCHCINSKTVLNRKYRVYSKSHQIH